MLGLPRDMSYLRMDVKMKEKVKLIPGIKQFIFVKLEERCGELFTAPLLGESNLLSNIVRADGFIITAGNKLRIKKGEKVSIFLFRK